MYFRNYGLPKTWLDQCLKSPISEDPTKSNMGNALKHCSNLKDTSLPYLLITWKSIVLQKVSFSHIQNVETVSQHTVCQWQVFSSC